MKTIFKYPLELTGDVQKIEMPKGSFILDGQIQRNQICIWVLCDPDASSESRHFFIAGTGHEMTTLPYKYLSTVQEGNFVWHIFEVKP